MESKIERVKSKNLFNFPPQGYYDEDLKGRLSNKTESVKKAILQSQIGAWEPKSRSLMADSRAVETAFRLS